MSAEACFPRTSLLRELMKSVFQIVEWMTVFAIIHYAAINNQSFSLWLMSWALQLALVVYVILGTAIRARPGFQQMKDRSARAVAAALFAGAVTLGANALVYDTVRELAQTQGNASASNKPMRVIAP